MKRIYVSASNCELKEEILHLVSQMNVAKAVDRIEKANIVILCDEWYNHATMRNDFNFGLKNGLKMAHYDPTYTTEFLFSIAREFLAKNGMLEKVQSNSRFRTEVIYRGAVCAFLLKSGLKPEIAALFVNRDRSLMYHYAKLHNAEMKTTPLYRTVYETLMRKVL